MVFKIKTIQVKIFQRKIIIKTQNKIITKQKNPKKPLICSRPQNHHTIIYLSLQGNIAMTESGYLHDNIVELVVLNDVDWRQEGVWPGRNKTSVSVDRDLVQTQTRRQVSCCFYQLFVFLVSLLKGEGKDKGKENC
jgi:hypothetical protein